MGVKKLAPNLSYSITFFQGICSKTFDLDARIQIFGIYETDNTFSKRGMRIFLILLWAPKVAKMAKSWLKSTLIIRDSKSIVQKFPHHYFEEPY